MDDVELASYLATHGAHEDLVRWGFVREVSQSRFQVVHPPALIDAIREGRLVGQHAEIAAGLVLECKPPKGFWYAETPAQLLERIHEGQPL